MWCKQNEDTSWVVCNVFYGVIGDKVILVDESYDKRKRPKGFDWESDADVINGYLAHNADLLQVELNNSDNSNNG